VIFLIGCAFAVIAIVALVCLLDPDVVRWVLTGSPR
jgi:hypothetical protein